MTDKTPERTYHHGSLPAALTAAALALLDERGVTCVTVREVARRAGVSPGAPFRHFADRKALLTAVAERVLADFETWQRVVVATAEGSAMRAFGLGFVQYAVRHPHRFELVRARAFGPAQDAGPGPRLSGVDVLLTEVITADQEAGWLRREDPARLGLAGRAVVYGLSQMFVDGCLPTENAEEVAGQVLDTLCLGLIDHGNHGG